MIDKFNYSANGCIIKLEDLIALDKRAMEDLKNGTKNLDAFEVATIIREFIRLVNDYEESFDKGYKEGLINGMKPIIMKNWEKSNADKVEIKTRYIPAFTIKEILNRYSKVDVQDTQKILEFYREIKKLVEDTNE